MYQTVTVQLSNLLLSLSDALDLASPPLSLHQIRTAYISWILGEKLQIPNDLEIDIFITALLHDVGALTPEEKVSIHQIEVENPEAHCILGEKFFKRVPALEKMAPLVRFHHTGWRDYPASLPAGLRRGAQIIRLADEIERAMDRQVYILHQEERLRAYIASLSGTELDPLVSDAFQSIAHREDFWLDLMSPRLYSILLNRGPARGFEIGLDQLLTISEMFRNMIDFRSPFTASHSSGVSAAAAAITRLFGFTEAEVKMMEIAGNLHDLGKMVVPNSILTKPGKLTPEEYAIVRQHTYYTYAILNTIGGIQNIAEWAAFHHERLDGSGYPFHLEAGNLSLNVRIMAVADTFTALAEDRPYRPAMEKAEVLRTLRQFSERRWLDAHVVELVERNYDEICTAMCAKQAGIRSFYEQEFMEPVHE